jgi:hypothetical protein
MKKMNFGAVYNAPPFFITDLDQMGYVEISELNISPQVSKKIENWNSEFQKTFDENYPPDSRFLDPELIKQHNARGVEITNLLMHELGDKVVIKFIPLNVV